MSYENATIAVTALNATDNPGPGVAVIRALRHNPDFEGRIIGLAYDSLEPGIYDESLVDDAYLLPYPSEGKESLLDRLTYIDEQVDLDVVIPTLDSELASFISLSPELESRGIATFMPTEQQLDVRSKAHLNDLGAEHDLPVPKPHVVTVASELYEVHEHVPYPFYVKGVFYGAKLARSIDEAVEAYHQIVAKWGVPVIIQQAVDGEELDVATVGDGKGGVVGAIPMRKTFITDKGKGWAGVAIKDPTLLELAERFIAATNWRGPCEVEIVKDEDEYYLLEVNPRFPAWIYLSAGAGMNLPEAVGRLALGQQVEPMTDFKAGTMFVRIALDMVGDMEDFQTVTSTGELHR